MAVTTWKRCILGFGLGLGAGAPIISFATAYLPTLLGVGGIVRDASHFIAVQASVLNFAARIAYGPLLRAMMAKEPSVFDECILSLVNVGAFALIGYLAWLARDRLLGQVGLWAGTSIVLIYLPEAVFIVPFFWWAHLYAWIILSVFFLVIMRPWRLLESGKGRDES